MADESKTGILGHLPPLPRPALNNSVIGMEQAYRQRKGLQLLTDADIEALKTGQPMPWEVGGVVSAPLHRAHLRTRTPTAAAPASAPPAAGAISEEVAKWVAQGNKWSKSTIAAEQARRGRKGLPALNNAEMSALLGEPVEASAPAAAAPAADTSSSCSGGQGPKRSDQCGSCEMGGRRKEVEQVDHCRRTGATGPQEPTRADRCGSCRFAGRTRSRRSARSGSGCGRGGQTCGSSPPRNWPTLRGGNGFARR